MPHPLQKRVESVRWRAIALVREHGVSLFAAASIAVLVSFGLFDYFSRFQDAGARWIVSLLALGIIGWVAWRLLVPAFRHRTSLVQVAQRIERLFPQLGQRLSSAMDFLAQEETDKTAGSADLRRAVVAEAEALSAGLDFSLAIDARKPRRTTWLALFAAACLAALVVSAPGSAQLAFRRLAMPWSDAAWPRRNTLEFVKRPEKLATGDDFEVELVDRAGRLPDRAQIQLRFATPSGTRTETKDMKLLADRMIFRMDNVTQGFAYRARGGDDDTMPWTELAVLEPPKVASLEVTVTPPEYTGLARQTAGRVVKAISGSKLAIRGKVDKPIVSARLRSESPGVTLPRVEIAPGGLSFAVPGASEEPWRIEKSAAYWIELADASGLPTGRDTRLEVQALPDSPPAISWETPGDHTFLTPRAVVPIKCLVKDDLAVQRVQLRYLRPGMSDQGELATDLFSGPVKAIPPAGMEDGDSRTIDLGWDLARLAGLAPGDVLAVRVTAEDYKPQLATSIVRRLTIITSEELESRIGQRQTSILGQLAEALRIQRECREQLAKLFVRHQEKGTLDENDLNYLQSAQLNQRQVEKLLGSGSDGAEGQLGVLLDELAANRVEGQALADRMNDLLVKVRKLNREPLVEIDRQLTDAFKTARLAQGGDRSADAAPALAAATSRQDEVIQSLEALLGTLTEWDSFSRLSREIGQIRSEQHQVSEGTETLRLAAVAADMLSADQRATARTLRQSELELARRLDKIQGRMHQMLGREQGIDPIAAGTLADALDTLRRLAIGGRMRGAAEKLGQHQFGESYRTQADVLEGLRQLLDLLSSRREDELARTIKSLRSAGTALAGLMRQQQAVQVELDAAMVEPNSDAQRRRVQRLAKELERLAQDIEPLRRQLQRLRAAQAAAAAQQAGEQNTAAGQSASQGNAADAQQQSRQAQSRLEDAQREVEQAIARAEQELVQQQLARLEQWISGLLARQKNVVAEATRLEEARSTNQGQLAASQRETLRNLAAEQRLIADETEQLRLKMTEQLAFAFALDGARQEMLRAAAWFQRGQTDQAPQQAARSAANRLEQMLAALQPDSAQPLTVPPADAPPQPAPAGGQKDPFSSLAALKLLELMQGEINRRTEELEKARTEAGNLTDEQTSDLEALATEQGRLAEMVVNLIRESAARPEDNPDLLPGGDPQGPP